MTPEELGNEKAFPLISPDGTGVNQGMTLREYFAAKAMQGLLASTDYDKEWDYMIIAKRSREIADHLLTELAKTY